ncbi:DUF3102 domain-containing protein [Nostoc sp. C052]|uniref:DUF3102 domain-containing protein n=1 Tax=Nostoc sp. C052 TaxID=2576902 RepID=UPI0015C33C72|nr:DUF3102 domain-containing protein [Nostoc sp. C052]QLE42238.1 DUF3102 domain-containing protein [Nostoc sp. C052]
MNLSELAININQAFDKSKEFYKAGINELQQALLCDKQAGDLLIQVKAELPYGQFTSWVEENCRFTMRHAQFLMKISREWHRIIKQWDELRNETRFASDSPLPSLRVAIALAAAEPKPESPPSLPVTKYKVALKDHACYGETVEVKEELSKGDVILCRTSKGEIPFLKKELVPESQSLQPVDAEIIDVEVEDISEQLKEAIALVIEYLSENELKAVLAASLSIGKEHLPSDAAGLAAKLIGGQDLAILSQG